MNPDNDKLVQARRPSILVVDDMRENLELLDAVFQKQGYDVSTALNAKEAMQIYQDTPVDLAVLDVMMPGMNGFELCRAFKKMTERSFFPIILLTALNEKKDRIAGLEAGADDFISKPFDFAELLIKIRSLLRLKELHEELDHSESIIFSLVIAMEARDNFTKGHSTRVGDLARDFGAFLGFSEKDQRVLRKAGILHDIGKIGLSCDLLQKPSRLSETEKKIVQTHAIIGEDICRPLKSLKEVLPAIRYHHERWDGRGFPDGLNGTEVPLMARILSILDAFDAISSARPYRNGKTVEHTLNVISDERRDGQWDPELTDMFLRMMSETVERNTQYA